MKPHFTTEPKTITCYKCGSEVDFEESLGAEIGKRGKWRDVCRECYDGIVSTCQLCGEDDVMPSDVSEYIVVKAELSTTDRRPPGIYRITNYPFLSIPLIGSGWMYGSDLLFIDRLPKPDHEYEISGHICKKCSIPYDSTYRLVYRIRPSMAHFMRKYRGCSTREAKWIAVLNREAWHIEIEHTRRTILSNRDMLRDLEGDNTSRDANGNYISCSNSYHWEEIKRRYSLPQLPTYREWLYFEHRGIKIYSTSEPWSDWFGASWLTLRPEPCYRNTHGTTPFLLDASSLPTYKKVEGQEYHYGKSQKEKEAARNAIIAAIDKGLITKEGLVR